MRRSAAFSPLALVSIWLVVVVLPPGLATARDISWVPKLDSGQVFEAGSVTGLFGGGLSLSTAGSDRVVVVAASDSESKSEAGRVPVILTGRLPVRVIGPVRSGDLLFASGRNDGTASGLAPSEITPAKLRLLVGRALEAQPVTGVRAVDALIGFSDRVALVDLLEERDHLIKAQNLELAALRSIVADLADLETEVLELRRATATLQAIEEARQPEELAPLPLQPDR